MKDPVNCYPTVMHSNWNQVHANPSSRTVTVKRMTHISDIPTAENLQTIDAPRGKLFMQGLPLFVVAGCLLQRQVSGECGPPTGLAGSLPVSGWPPQPAWPDQG
jgi:hypothetical protein